MSTFLELCQELRQECSISGDGPTSVENQTGELKQVVDWIRKSWINLQNRHGGRWRWLHREFTFNTVASQSAYEFGACNDVLSGQAIDRFASWDLNRYEDPPKMFRASTGVGDEGWLHWMDLASFRNIHRIGTQNPIRPLHITVDPQDRILLGPTPNDIYTVTGWYYRGPQELIEDGDVPEMPKQFHELIVYQAAKRYAFKYVAQEFLEQANTEGRQLLRDLEANYAPRIEFAAPMVP